MLPLNPNYQKISKSPEDMKTGELLQYKRTRIFNMSQDDFAKKFGVSLGTLRNWEQGVSLPPPYFMMLLDDEEKLLSIRMATPVERMRQAEDDNYSSERRKILRQYARENLEKDALFKEAYDCIEQITGPEGFAESLQNLYPFFENSSMGEFTAFMQLALLKRIDDKLNRLIEK